MKQKTRQQITALYWNWCRRGREDYGLPFSLADYLHQIQRIREMNAHAQGESTISLEQHAQAVGLPLDFLQELDAALAEGVTDDEMKELANVQAPAKPV